MCVLRASGSGFIPEDYLCSSGLSPYQVYHRGDPLFRKSKPGGPRFEESGFKASVSDRDWSDLPGQIEDAIDFLQRYRDDLERLRAAPGIEDVRLDFPYRLRIDGEAVWAQFDYLPPMLLELAGTLGVGIELSLYPPGKDTDDSGGDPPIPVA